MNAQATQFDPDRLITLLTQQRDLYRDLRTLSEKQRQMISGDRPEKLLTILKNRQDLVTSLARLNEELGPYRRNWDAIYSALPEDQRTVASAMMHEISGLLRTILQTDQEDGALLAARKQAVGTELGQVGSSRAANAAYGRQTPPSKSADVTG